MGKAKHKFGRIFQPTTFDYRRVFSFLSLRYVLFLVLNKFRSHFGSRARTPDPKLVSKKGSPACRGFPNGSLLRPIAHPSHGCIIHPCQCWGNWAQGHHSALPGLRSLRTVAPIWRSLRTVAPIWISLRTVAPIWRSLRTVAPIWRSLRTVAPIWRSLSTVAPIWRSLRTVAPIWRSLRTVAPIWRSLRTVAPIWREMLRTHKG